MYHGQDRVRQVDSMRNLAHELAQTVTTDLYSEYPNKESLAAALVLDWMLNPESDVPTWFDQYDVRFLTERLTKVL